MNNPVYLGLSILESNKILLYEFWYDDVKPKYGEKAKLCYMYTAGFIVYTKTDTIYKNITEDIIWHNLIKCVIKRKRKFESYKNCLEATQLDDKINYIEKNKIDIDGIKENHKEFIKNNKSILITQQRFKKERHNVLLKKLIRRLTKLAIDLIVNTGSTKIIAR